MYAVTGDGSLPEGRFLFRYLPPPLTSAGRRERRPLQRRPVRLLIAALHPTLLHSVAAASRHIPLPFNHPYQTKSRGEHFVRPGGLTSSES